MAAFTVTYTFVNGTAADGTQVNQNFTDLINGMASGAKDTNFASLVVGGLSLFSAGTAANPSIASSSYTTSGIYWASGKVGISIAGTSTFEITAATTTVAQGNLTLTTGQILSASGTVSLPGLSLAAETSSGIYRIGSLSIGFAVGGSLFYSVGSSAVNIASSICLNAAGTIAANRANVASTATIASMASSTSYVKLTGSTATDLQGIAAGGFSGQLLILTNLTGQTLTIRNQSASAASGDKIRTMTGADVTTTGNGAAGFIYDTDASPAEWTCIWNTA